MGINKQRAAVFDRVIVMDPINLSASAFIDLAEETGIACYPGLRVLDINGLCRALLRHDRERLLVITTVTGLHDSLTDGFAMLESLRWRQTSGTLGLMVCTDMDDPLMLKRIAQTGPAVITLKTDPIDVLCRHMWLAAECCPSPQCSPTVLKALEAWKKMRTSPRELEWLVTQVDGMNLMQSAEAMSVCDKTAWSWRYTLSKRLGGKMALIRYIAHLQQILAC